MIESEKKRIRKEFQPLTIAVSLKIMTPNSPANQVYNPVENLSVADLKETLTGKLTEWRDVYPSNLGKIQVVFDHSGSSVAKYMTDSVLHRAPYAPNVYSA